MEKIIEECCACPKMAIFRKKLLSIIMAIITIITISSCGSNDDESEPSVYDPAGEMEGTYIGSVEITNGIVTYNLDNALFIIHKSTIGSIYFDIIREDGKVMLSEVYTTVGYLKDNTGGYNLASLTGSGTVTKDGHIKYSSSCTVSGVEGYNYTFEGYKVY